MQKNYEEIIQKAWLDEKTFKEFEKALKKRGKWKIMQNDKIHPLFKKWLSNGKL